MDRLNYYTAPLSIMSYILEDDQDDAEMTERIFKRNDFGDYKRFKKGSEVLLELSKQRVDIFISDFRGLDLDGIEVMKEVKKIHPRCYFIFMTAYVTNEIIDRAVNEIQIKHYVNKNRPDCFKLLEQFIADGVKSTKEDFEFMQRMKDRIDRLNPIEK